MSAIVIFFHQQVPPDYVIVDRGLDRDKFSFNEPDEYQYCDWQNALFTLTAGNDLGCTNLTEISETYIGRKEYFLEVLIMK